MSYGRILAAFVGALWVSGCVVLPDEYRLDELGDYDLEVLCDSDTHGQQECAGGWSAGFTDGASCVETLAAQRDQGEYDCQRKTVGDWRECLKIEPCERVTAPECEEVYVCVMRLKAEEAGIEYPYGYYGY